MKNLRFLALLAFLCGAFTFTSCDKEIDNEAEAAMKRAGDDIEAGARALSAEFKQETAELGRDLKAAKANVDARMERLEANMENAGAEAKAEMQEEMNELREFGRDLDTRMERVGNNIEDGWDDFKADTRRTLDRVNQSIAREMAEDDM